MLLTHLGCIDRAVTTLVVIGPKVAVPVRLDSLVNMSYPASSICILQLTFMPGTALLVVVQNIVLLVTLPADLKTLPTSWRNFMIV
jgi:hypothetical protein